MHCDHVTLYFGSAIALPMMICGLGGQMLFLFFKGNVFLYLPLGQALLFREGSSNFLFVICFVNKSFSLVIPSCLNHFNRKIDILQLA